MAHSVPGKQTLYGGLTSELDEMHVILNLSDNEQIEP